MDSRNTKEVMIMNKRNLEKRLERLEAGVQRRNYKLTFEFVNDSSPGGLTSVSGPDGREVWWNPPAGCKVGELVEGEKPAVRRSPRAGPHLFRILYMTGKGGPTTLLGPDGRLVWLEPPEGSKAGEAIEDHPTRSLPAEPFQEYDHDPESCHPETNNANGRDDHEQKKS
jgi:hypothetical protein